MKKFNLILPMLSVAFLASCVRDAKTTTPTSAPVETTTGVSTAGTIETTGGAKEKTTTGVANSGAELAYRVLDDSINTYYAKVDTTKTGEEFIASLTPVISANYVRFSYSGAWDVLKEADEDPYDNTKVVCVYTGLSILKSGAGSLWNREHTWAKSHGFPEETIYAYTDCHHLTAAHNSTNSTRGDLDFDEVVNQTGTVKNDKYGNKWIEGVCFEPRDEVKGDIARALLYMEARYNSTDLDLTLSETIPTETSKDTGKGSLGRLSTLLKWHYQDPVSDEEILRNEVVYKYQKNRNPYIDHPEWVNFAYDTEYATLTANKAKVNEAIAAIDALPTDITLENEDAVNDALALVNALNAQEKLYVNNYRVLSKAKYQIDYLNANAGDDAASKVIEFTTSTLATTSYEANKEITASDHKFTLSSAYGKDGDIRIGYNSKKADANKVDLSTIGATGYGAYLKAEFSTANLTGVTVEYATKPNNGVSKVYVIGYDGTNYTTLWSGTPEEDHFSATFDSFSGQIIIAVAGTNPVLYLTTMKLYTA